MSRLLRAAINYMANSMSQFKEKSNQVFYFKRKYQEVNEGEEGAFDHTKFSNESEKQRKSYKFKESNCVTVTKMTIIEP